MSRKKIPYPGDFANRPNVGKCGKAKYVLVNGPITAHVTITRDNVDNLYVKAWVGHIDTDETDITIDIVDAEYSYPCITKKEDLQPVLYRARKDILEYIRKQVVTWKNALNVAKV